MISTHENMISTHVEIPSTHENIISTQVEIPSTHENMISTQVEIPSTHKNLPVARSEEAISRGGEGSGLGLRPVRTPAGGRREFYILSAESRPGRPGAGGALGKSRVCSADRGAALALGVAFAPPPPQRQGPESSMASRPPGPLPQGGRRSNCATEHYNQPQARGQGGGGRMFRGDSCGVPLRQSSETPRPAPVAGTLSRCLEMIASSPVRLMYRIFGACAARLRMSPFTARCLRASCTRAFSVQARASGVMC
jgi:hypothetical protein